jgi:hypothetical protein
MPASDLSYYLAWLKEQLKPQVCGLFQVIETKKKNAFLG